LQSVQFGELIGPAKHPGNFQQLAEYLPHPTQQSLPT
jgi:hypothetical protein